MKASFPTSDYLASLFIKQQDERAIWDAEIADIAQAEAALVNYVEELERQFIPCGLHDTSRLPSGEAFKEFVCGGELSASQRRMYYGTTPLLAVRLFQQTIDAYVAAFPAGSRLYWRVFPLIERFHVQFIEEGSPFILQPEWLFDIRCRLVILPVESNSYATQ